MVASLCFVSVVFLGRRVSWPSLQKRSPLLLVRRKGFLDPPQEERCSPFTPPPEAMNLCLDPRNESYLLPLHQWLWAFVSYLRGSGEPGDDQCLPSNASDHLLPTELPNSNLCYQYLAEDWEKFEWVQTLLCLGLPSIQNKHINLYQDFKNLLKFWLTSSFLLVWWPPVTCQNETNAVSHLLLVVTLCNSVYLVTL